MYIALHLLITLVVRTLVCIINVVTLLTTKNKELSSYYYTTQTILLGYERIFKRISAVPP